MSQLNHSDIEKFVAGYTTGVKFQHSPELVAANMGLSMGQFWYRLRKINSALSRQCGCVLPPLNMKYQHPDYSKIADKFNLRRPGDTLVLEPDDYDVQVLELDDDPMYQMPGG